MADANQKILNRISDKLHKSEPIHITLPGKGIFKMEQPVPFLIVYRLPVNGKDHFNNSLVKTEASYIIIQDCGDHLLQEIILTVTHHLSDKFKGFLILEIWMSANIDQPPFIIYSSQKSAIDISRKLNTELSKIVIQGWSKTAATKRTDEPVAPPQCEPLVGKNNLQKRNITLMGLEIAPVYINTVTGKPFPLLFRDLRDKYSKALRKSFFEFIRLHTSYNASHFQMLGTTTIDDTIKNIDHELAAYSKLFDFLLLVTPINVEQAWQEFKNANFLKEPVFHYRPMPVDPEIVKRKLYNLPVEEINDPTLAFLFRDKRKEIDRMLNMLQEREKHDFMLSSLQVFGPVSEQLLDVAKALLVAVESNVQTKEMDQVPVRQFALMAQKELQWLQLQYPQLSDVVRIADDVEGILVSKGVLNISSNFSISKERAMPLLQHEVGTHVVTFYNGKAQPLELFSIGVPGYEELQEGLAVFAEYLCGGLTAGRMRTLAGRVVAVNEMVSGKTFTETFQMLTGKYEFSEKSAFNISMRVYRGGGLTKDAVYLKGLLNIIDYIKKGKDLKQLLVGKIRQDYLPIVQELIHRKILIEAPVTPRFLSEDYAEKLEAVKADGNIFKMIQE